MDESSEGRMAAAWYNRHTPDWVSAAICPDCGGLAPDIPARLDGYHVWRCRWCYTITWKPTSLRTLGYPMYTHPDRALGLNLFFTVHWIVLLALLAFPAFFLAVFIRLCQSTVRVDND